MSNDPMEAMIEESMFADLRDALLTELKEAGDPWQMMSQSRQDEIIERIDKRVGDRIREAAGLMVTHSFPAVEGTIDGITVKDDTKIVVKIGVMTPDCHDMIDAGRGASVRLVLADARAFTGLAGSVTSDADQPSLDIPEAPAFEEKPEGVWRFTWDGAERGPFDSKEDAEAAWQEMTTTAASADEATSTEPTGDEDGEQS